MKSHIVSIEIFYVDESEVINNLLNKESQRDERSIYFSFYFCIVLLYRIAKNGLQQEVIWLYISLLSILIEVLVQCWLTRVGISAEEEAFCRYKPEAR